MSCETEKADLRGIILKDLSDVHKFIKIFDQKTIVSCSGLMTIAQISTDAHESVALF